MRAQGTSYREQNQRNQEQLRHQEQFIQQLHRDHNWNAQFGKIQPENVLREARDMAELENMAKERRMELDAQTSEEARRIWISYQKQKAWRAEQSLRSEQLKTRLAYEKDKAARREAFAKYAREVNQRIAQGIATAEEIAAYDRASRDFTEQETRDEALEQQQRTADMESDLQKMSQKMQELADQQDQQRRAQEKLLEQQRRAQMELEDQLDQQRRQQWQLENQLREQQRQRQR